MELLDPRGTGRQGWTTCGVFEKLLVPVCTYSDTYESIVKSSMLSMPRCGEAHWVRELIGSARRQMRDAICGAAHANLLYNPVAK